MNQLLMRHNALSVCEQSIGFAVEKIINCYENGGKVLICGNGGSSADGEHIVGELMKGFLKSRPIPEEKRAEMLKNYSIDGEVLDKLQMGLPAISLPSIVGLNSAFCNDVSPELIYAQGVFALAKKEDVLIAISTSGNSKNVVQAVKVAKSLGITVISLTGKTGGLLKDLSTVCICVPETETYKVQELHLPVYHYICAEVEKHFFKA
ncbi:MAG: SIS domain-containing protein [Clostridia bacterium]|nr:SIS domain-containing protein [Clostridia bacterium]